VAFRGNFDGNEISVIFRRNFAMPIVSIRVIFRTLIRSSRKFIANFQVYIRSFYDLRFHYKSSIDYMYVNILSVKQALQLPSFASQTGSAVVPNSPLYFPINAVIPAPESIKVAANLL